MGGRWGGMRWVCKRFGFLQLDCKIPRLIPLYTYHPIFPRFHQTNVDVCSGINFQFLEFLSLDFPKTQKIDFVSRYYCNNRGCWISMKCASNLQLTTIKIRSSDFHEVHCSFDFYAFERQLFYRPFRNTVFYSLSNNTQT